MSYDYTNANVLVTGGMGFIGSNLCIKLVEQGANVTVVDSMIPGHGGNLFNIGPIQDRITVNYSDIRDKHSLSYLVQGKDYIFNLAGQVSHIDSMEDPMTDLDINCKAQLSLLESCRLHNKNVQIIFASTRQIYGKPQYLPVDEKHLLEPVDVNGINKMAGEWYHLLYSRVYDMKCTALRLTNTYGPRQKINNMKLGFVGTFILRALKGEEIQIFGDGSQLRDFNYVDDVVEAFLIAGQNTSLCGEMYNLGHHNHYSLKQFVDILSSLCDFKFTTIPFPEDRKKIDIGDYYSSYNRFKETTKWVPQVDLKEGLTKSVIYFRENLEHYV